MIPVEGHKNLFRDENTNAIVSRDTAAYENYIALRNKNRDKQDELNDMKKELENRLKRQKRAYKEKQIKNKKIDRDLGKK